ncbi:MAG: glycosyltransferase family 8 protein [Planctomycetes bacterium]|nr:glycosyltransferase family 8 protein [Planctomycetota bacterium]
MEIPPAPCDAGIAVFLACDENFFPYTITTIASFMENARSGDRYDVVVLTCNGVIPSALLETALEWFGKTYPTSSLRFFDGDQLLQAAGRDKFYATKHFSVATYLRFFAPSIFKQYDRMLYLDSDMIIFSDLGELYRTDLGGNILGACHDVLSETAYREGTDPKEAAYRKNVLGLEPEDGYFNAGMIVFDLNTMRELDIQSRLVQALDYINNANLPDQDILNHVCKGRVHFIDPGWNVTAWMIEPRPGTIYHFASGAVREACHAVRDSVKLLHFTELKPWNANYTGCLDCYYWHYSALTPFHAMVVNRWKRDTGVVRSVPSLAKLAFHVGRCGLSGLIGPDEKREKEAKRLYEYKLRLKARARRLFQTEPPDVPVNGLARPGQSLKVQK